jgi:hypothetical protein
MEEYTVFFEVYGKKLRTTVQASDEIQAMEIVKNSINVIKVSRTPPPTTSKTDDSNIFGHESEFENYFRDLLDMINKKK